MTDAVAAPADERERVLDLVRRHGWNSTAFQTLEPGYSYVFHGDACVAYVETRGARVVAGAPIAPAEEVAATARAFVRDSAEAGKRCCFVATEDRFVAATADFLRAERIGEQPVWDPRAWPERLKQRKSLREQLRRARAKGLRVRELAPAELESGA
ncbi:MAG TPA: phosphatidylglycerol lysyltransferase domain-containing protein, partial [Nannocystaceae bacterium]|nr:phosphatidylglycerol lysyltransferase domain-containing protein [Nannocystaceae bacterium]